HSRLVGDYDFVRKTLLSSLVLQQALYGHGIVEPNLLQFFYGAHARCDCNNFPAAFIERPVKFEQRGSFPGSCSTANVDRQVTTSEHKLNCVPLFRTQLAG